MGIIERHYETINNLFKKWNDPNEGCTTEELMELKESLEAARRDVNLAISLRRMEEE